MTDPCPSCAELRARITQLEHLLRRIREWDQLPTCCDGPYWIREIEALGLTDRAPRVSSPEPQEDR
jgi:hypothetical protein